MVREDAFVGALMGFALGDAFGAPFEGFSREEVERRLKHFESKGKMSSEFTDDTLQMLILAESLANTIYFNPSDFAERLRMYYETGKLKKTGPTSSQALERLKLGYSWKESGIDSGTCGSAMRVAPVGLLYSFDLNLVEEYSALQSIVTHTGKEAIAGCVAVALTYALILKGLGISEIRKELVRRLKAFDAYTTLLVDRAFLGEFEYRGTILASDVVPAAIQCFVYSESFEDCLRKSVSLGGDTDSIAAIAGGMKSLQSCISEECDLKISLKIDVDCLDRVKEVAKKLWKVYEFIS
ncbi:MAG: ADP-ribosylglycohydrolase family protein [Archaeoglobus sp.]|jgi:ADP-ribosylglycohydrolase|nr:MAG: ADP-ribosylglycohydrolase family protein [Archaeoglobus sp.]